MLNFRHTWNVLLGWDQGREAQAQLRPSSNNPGLEFAPPNPSQPLPGQA